MDSNEEFNKETSLRAVDPKLQAEQISYFANVLRTAHLGTVLTQMWTPRQHLGLIIQSAQTEGEEGRGRMPLINRLPVVTARDQITPSLCRSRASSSRGSAVQDRNVDGTGSRASITPSTQGLEHSHCQVPGAHSRAWPNIDTKISKLNLATRNLHGWKCSPL